VNKPHIANHKSNIAHNIFISASHKDRDLARDLAHRLKEAGVKVTYSELTLSGESGYEKEFMRLLKDADEIIVILSRNSLDNLWMMFEIGAASSLRKKITPVVVGLEKHELPPVITQLKYIRYDRLSEYISSMEKSPRAA
jgi:TIR domain-containing protein